MKKLLSLILAIAMIACLGVSFVSCGEDSSSGGNDQNTQSSSENGTGNNGPDDGDSDNDGSDDSQGGNSGSTSIGPTITKEDWASILNTNNFMATIQDDTNSMSIKVTKNAIANLVEDEVKSYNVYKNGVVYNVMETGGEFLGMKSEMSQSDFTLGKFAFAGALTEATFDKLSYDSENECYTIKTENGMEHTLYFNDGILCIAELTMMNKTYTIIFSEYGTTSVTVPEFTIIGDESESDKNETDSSETDKSETDSSETDKSETDSSETDKSETDKSETDSSETDSSETDKSETDNGETDDDSGSVDSTAAQITKEQWANMLSMKNFSSTVKDSGYTGTIKVDNGKSVTTVMGLSAYMKEDGDVVWAIMKIGGEYLGVSEEYFPLDLGHMLLEGVFSENSFDLLTFDSEKGCYSIESALLNTDSTEVAEEYEFYFENGVISKINAINGDGVDPMIVENIGSTSVTVPAFSTNY